MNRRIRGRSGGIVLLNQRVPAGHWCISVLGKNGVSVNGKHYGPPDTCPLASQDLINMGEQSFWFLLPRCILSLHSLPKPIWMLGVCYHSLSAVD